MTTQAHQPIVDDETIREIVEQAEPGVADLVAAYEESERHYFAAAEAATARPLEPSYATHT